MTVINKSPALLAVQVCLDVFLSISELRNVQAWSQ